MREMSKAMTETERMKAGLIYDCDKEYYFRDKKIDFDLEKCY